MPQILGIFINFLIQNHYIAIALCKFCLVIVRVGQILIYNMLQKITSLDVDFPCSKFLKILTPFFIKNHYIAIVLEIWTNKRKCRADTYIHACILIVPDNSCTLRNFDVGRYSYNDVTTYLLLHSFRLICHL